MSDLADRARQIRIEDEISRRNIKLSGRGPERYGPCPVCGGTDRFSINIKKQLWNCRGCAKGGDAITFVMHVDRLDFLDACRAILRDGPRPQVQSPERPKEEKESNEDKSKLAHYLWSRSLPAAESLVETYLKSRQCWIDSPNIRFLPGRGEHPHSMISRFGGGPVTAVHLTKLRPDGSGKAKSGKDKIMIGPSIGQPIVVMDNPEREEIVIAEGIEDAATLTLATGWSAWAAGSAGRIPQTVKAAPKAARLYLAVDRDIAGDLALKRSRDIRRDIVPLHFAKALDANAMAFRFGANSLLALIEWGEAQTDFRIGKIGSEAMLAAQQRANAVFAEILA